jgi:hypothetical protein
MEQVWIEREGRNGEKKKRRRWGKRGPNILEAWG